jgi:hypothetical protein
MVRSPITEEASIPNEQASAQIASHELRARDRLRIITSYKEQDIILAGEGGARMLTGFAPNLPWLGASFYWTLEFEFLCGGDNAVSTSFRAGNRLS